MKRSIRGLAAVVAVVTVAGCTTPTHRYAEGEARATVAGFSEFDINDVTDRAIAALMSSGRMSPRAGAVRAVVVADDVIADTTCRGSEATGLADTLGISIRERLSASGKVDVFNERAAQGAKVQIVPQYRLRGRLTERNLRTDDNDYQREYNLNLTLIELETGLETWQKRIHVGKLIDKKNLMN